jgi:hypothetical protein
VGITKQWHSLRLLLIYFATELARVPYMEDVICITGWGCKSTPDQLVSLSLTELPTGLKFF